jgi:hypothetical protein
MTPNTLKKKKPAGKKKQPSFMNHLKPTTPTGKGLGKPKIQVK